MEKIFLSKGEKIIYEGREALIIKIITIDSVLIEEISNGARHEAPVSKIRPIKPKAEPLRDIAILTEKQWDEARRRHSIILPVLEKRGDAEIVKNVSTENSIGPATIYRWVKLYEEYGTIASLLGKEKPGGRGSGRLAEEQETIVAEVITKSYLSSSRHSIKKTIRDVKMRFDEMQIPAPHDNTIRNRIKSLSEEQVLRKRIGEKEANFKFNPSLGSFPGGEYPYAVVQIDHTKVDLILVNEHTRKTYKRPWLTVAIDVFSRMIVGFNLSFDPPGALGTGLCIAHSILPKELWLNSIGVEASWPCWGLMNTIHADNAKEFRGNMLRRACENYGINLEFRPLTKPNYGAHIERLLGTFMKEIHDLPGTTFSSVAERGNYPSEKLAAMSISEFEKWLTYYITTVYHKNIHSSLGMSPEEKMNEGVFGTSDSPGVGSRPRIIDEKKLRLDFMPYVERTVQEYGVMIDHIFYYSDMLRRYVHAKDGRQKKKFLFRRDPRNISFIQFYEPDEKKYYKIPYRDLTLPPVSIWEVRGLIRRLVKNGREVNQENIFKAFRMLDDITANAVKKTRKQQRIDSRPAKLAVADPVSNTDNLEAFQKEQEINDEEITPFEDIEDGAPE